MAIVWEGGLTGVVLLCGKATCTTARTFYWHNRRFVNPDSPRALALFLATYRLGQ